MRKKKGKKEGKVERKEKGEERKKKKGKKKEDIRKKGGGGRIQTVVRIYFPGHFGFPLISQKLSEKTE